MNIKEISISVEQEKSVSLEVSKSNEIGIGFEKREVLSEPRIERAFYDFDFTFNEEDGSLSLTLIQNNGVSKNLKIDLPTEELVKNVYYDNDNKEINIEWENGQATKIPLSGLVDTYKADEVTLTLDNETKTFKIKEEYLTASNIKVDSSKTGTTATNVESALKELKEEIKSTADEVKDGVVTGIKGSEETDFRKGQVEITKENIGLGNVLNVGSYSKEESDNKYQVQGDYATRSEIPTTLPASDVYSWAKEPTKPSYDKSEIGLGNVDNTSDADKPISTATQQALDNVIEIAEGKTKTYVIEVANNTSFNSQEDTIRLLFTSNIITISGETILGESLKVGDIIIVKDLDVPDRYVGKKNEGEVLNYLDFYILETQKVDLSDYALNEEIVKIKDGNTIVKKAEQDGSGNNIVDTYMPKSGGTFNGSVTLHKNSIADKLLLHENGYIKIEDMMYSGTTTILSSKIDLKSSAMPGTQAKITIDGEKVTTENSFKTINGESIVGTGNIVTKLEDSGVEAGTYSAVQVNAKGIVTSGKQIIEVGVAGQTEPSESLAKGGIFFQEI
jgi:hypothetical protein